MCTPKPQRACFLIGHRDAPPGVCPALEAEIIRHITELGVVNFYVGHFGSFDQYASGILCSVKKQHPEIRLHIAVPFAKNLKLLIPMEFEPFPYYPAQDLDRIPKAKRVPELYRAMVRKCDYLITYAHHPKEPAYSVLQYARKIRGSAEITNLDRQVQAGGRGMRTSKRRFCRNKRPPFD